MTDVTATAGKVLRVVPVTVWIAAAGAVVLYVLGRRALAKLGGNGGGVAGVGEAIGAGAASLVEGGVAGAAKGIGGIFGAIIKAPSNIADATVQSATDGRGLSLGSWLYDLFHDDPNLAPPPPKSSAPQDERTWYEFWRKG